MTLDEMVNTLAEVMVMLRRIQNLDPALMQDIFINQYVKFMEITQFLTAVFGTVSAGTIDHKEEAIKKVLEQVQEQSIILLQLYETQRVLKGLE
jgi:hypothetical protein